MKMSFFVFLVSIFLSRDLVFILIFCDCKSHLQNVESAPFLTFEHVSVMDVRTICILIMLLQYDLIFIPYLVNRHERC